MGNSLGMRTVQATGMIAANCHKLPESVFRRRRLTPEEIVRLWEKPLSTYLEDKEVIFTVSPVRHLRDGLAENRAEQSDADRGGTYPAGAVRQLPLFSGLRNHDGADLRDYRFCGPGYDPSVRNGCRLHLGTILRMGRSPRGNRKPSAGSKRCNKRSHTVRSSPGSDAHKVFRQRLRGEIQALSETYPELDFSEELNCSAHLQ